MTTRYHHDGQAAYGCSSSRADHEATPTCRSIRADIVDEAVVATVLATLSPEQIELALAASDEVADRHSRSHRAAELAVERAQYDADRAERAFTAVEPENRMVARTLEARWEARLTALDQAQAALAAAREARPALPDRSALRALAVDLPGLWHAPDTKDRDRKRLLRTLVADVTLLPEPVRARARVGVRWHTGATDELDLARPLTSPEVRRTPQAARELIAELRPNHSDQQIVATLADAGLTTGTGRPYDVAAVKWVAHTYKIPAPSPFRDGEVSVDQAAQQLGITTNAVYYWLTHGRLTARKDITGRWCIPWNKQVEAECRRQIDTSGHLTPRPATPPRTLPGELSVQQAAARLGVVEHAVYYWIRCGRLTARKDVGGRWCIPWDDQVEADCRDWITHPEQFMPTGRRPLPAEAVRADEISIPEAAARLGVLDAAVRYQVRIGRLPAHRTPGGRIAIPWNDHVAARLRADLDRPKHPGPTGPGSHPLPEATLTRGELSVQQVSVRLGVRAGAIYYWITCGYLEAHRAADGRLSIPWTSDNEATCLQLAAQTMKSTPETRTLTAGGAV
jgi:excisionase family DNA binding protein